MMCIFMLFENPVILELRIRERTITFDARARTRTLHFIWLTHTYVHACTAFNLSQSSLSSCRPCRIYIPKWNENYSYYARIPNLFTYVICAYRCMRCMNACAHTYARIYSCAHAFKCMHAYAYICIHGACDRYTIFWLRYVCAHAAIDIDIDQLALAQLTNYLR